LRFGINKVKFLRFKINTGKMKPPETIQFCCASCEKLIITIN